MRIPADESERTKLENVPYNRITYQRFFSKAMRYENESYLDCLVEENNVNNERRRKVARKVLVYGLVVVGVVCVLVIGHAVSQLCANLLG